MTARPPEIAVLGLGALGSATLWHLAKRGIPAIGFDRYTPPHHFGSSHGHTRIIREAYFEDPMYVPLVQRAAALWTELAGSAGTTLITRTGGLSVGHREGPLVRGAAESARIHRLPCEVLSPAQIRRRVPALRPADDMIGVWEPGAGVLYPEHCVATLLQQAEQAGARIVLETLVTGCQPARGDLVIATAAGDYRVNQVIVTAGPWTTQVLSDWRLPLTVERAVQYWFEPVSPGRFGPQQFPVFLLEYAPDRLLYGLPDVGHGVKVAHHHGGRLEAIDHVHRLVDRNEVDEMRATLRAWLPDAAGSLRDATVCLYTNTPDHHFLIDRHPRVPGMLVASCCSGHGFKFVTAIGEILADLVTGSPTAFDLTPFRASRFGG